MAYCVAKAALNHMTSFAASDYARYGIRVNAILPGTTSTPLLHNVFNEEQIRDMVADQQAITRLLEPEDQANAILFLASEEASMTTGHLKIGRAHVGTQVT